MLILGPSWALHALGAFCAFCGTDPCGQCFWSLHKRRDYGVRKVFYPEHPAQQGGGIRCGAHFDSSAFPVGGLRGQKAPREGKMTASAALLHMPSSA